MFAKVCEDLLDQAIWFRIRARRLSGCCLQALTSSVHGLTLPACPKRAALEQSLAGGNRAWWDVTANFSNGGTLKHTRGIGDRTGPLSDAYGIDTPKLVYFGTLSV